MLRKSALLLFFFLLTFFSIEGQFTYQKFYHLSRSNGLSQSTVNCIVKDSTGFMWFGTNDGLNRYDGYKFTHYKYDPSNAKSIGIGRVRALFLDSRGRLWVGTDQGGLFLYREKSDNFLRYPRSLKQHERNQYGDIREILETSDGRLWIATVGSGLLLFDPDRDTIIEFRDENLLNLNCIEFFGNDLYIGSEVGLYKLPDARNGKESGVTPKLVEEFKDISIFKIHEGTDKLLWVGTYGKGAFSYNPQTGTIVKYSSNGKEGFRLSHDIVRDFIEAEDQNSLIIATGGGGLNILNRNSGKINAIRSKLNDQFSLNSDIIYTLYRDDIQNLWIGTYNGGANVLFKTKDKFGHIKSFGGKNELSNNSVLSLVEAADGKLWIGTDGGGLDLYDPLNGTFRNFKNEPGNPNSLSGNVVKSLLLDRSGKLWIGTFNQGLTVYDPDKNKFIRYYANPGDSTGLSLNHIWDIAEDANGNIWIATLGGGLDRINVATGKFSHYDNNPDVITSLSDNVVSCLLYDSKGNLWIGTEYGGVNKLLDPDRGIFKVYNRGDNEGLISSNQISTIFEDSQHGIWVGTIGGGLNRYDEEQDRFVNYTEADGLPNNLIYGLLEDDKGNLWISSNNGISKFVKGVQSPQNNVFQNYTAGDGLQSNEFSSQATCKTSNGLLYFGGINGINFFDPSRIIINDHIPPVVITDIKIFNKSIYSDHSNVIVAEAATQLKELRLSYKQSVITFEFAALDFTMPSKNKYKYMLEGFENRWNEVGNNRTATYTNLNHGKYIFRVKGSNNDEKWNEQGTSITIIIKPPFWKTWFFRIGMILLAFAFIVLLYRLKLRSLENNKRILKSLVDERTRSLLDLNHLLEKQNREIQYHREELLHQKENLIKINKELARNKDKIQEQNDELEHHRHNLEKLVNERTSELEKAKIKAEESDRLKSSFLSNMSHEIRTPLNAIVGFSSLLGEPDLTHEERNDFVRQINANSETLLVLIDDILDLSKIESNQLKIVYSSIDINEFLDELFNSFTFRTKQNIRFELINPYREDKLTIKSDRTRLRQILTNLLDNAFKFTENGFIEFGIDLKPQKIVFFVRDTGIGMSDLVMNRIFERFYKSDENGERVYRGTGLGLTITKKLIEILDGKISVRSNEGVGSYFEITFSF